MLSAEDTEPLKLKTFQVGPLAHVLDRSPVVSALWHPLASQGNCLVTVTEDAVVRLWELSKDSRWSFNEPALALDLRKLANGASSSQDYSPSKYGTNVGFSPDQFEMEVASACFGGCGFADEGGWAPMTLWIAMKNGDVYALCPLLPSQWTISTNQISQLLATIENEDMNIQNDQNFREKNVVAAEQQSDWAADILRQQQEQEMDAMDSDRYIYHRPFATTTVPALQGPYHVEPDPDVIFDVTDIFAVAPNLESQSDESHHPNMLDEDSVVPASMICIATGDGKVHICMDAEGTAPRWLADKSHGQNTMTKFNEEQLPELVLIESIRTYDDDIPSWPMFSTCQNSRRSAYVTHSKGMYYIQPIRSLKGLSEELDDNVEQNGDYRIKIIAQSAEAEVQTLISFPEVGSTFSDKPTAPAMPTACMHIRDADLGDVVLSTAKGQPYAVKLDFSTLDLLFEGDDYDYGSDEEINTLFPEETRPSYQPPQELWAETTLPLFVEEQKDGPARQLMERELRLAPATVNLMMEAHRLLGTESGQVQGSVSNLFQRCQRIQDELMAQLERVAEINVRIDSVLDDNADVDEDDEGTEITNLSIAKRIQAVQSRHDSLQDRFSQLRTKVGQLDHRPLNEKEQPWIDEIRNLEQMVIGGSIDSHAHAGGRYEDIQNVKEELMTRCEAVQLPEEQSNAETTARQSQVGMGRVDIMLERETALVEATVEKLEQLKVLV